jgi:CHAD domain-containing protein
MNRSLEELSSLRTSPDADTVHDLRVAIRRCRSVAAVMEEIDPDPAWSEMRKVARRLFRGLGEFRDGQVMADWISKLGPETDPLKTKLLASLEAEEKQHYESAMRVSEKFHEKDWVQLEQHLRQRVRLVPVGGLAAECLALERFEEARELHARAQRTEKPKAWHALRIGLKRFRYTLEGFLPEHYAAWSENLKRLQDLLGDVHDLDVLADKLEAPEAAEFPESANAWQARIAEERRQRIETYRQLTLGKTSVWNEWRHNLPYGERLEAAAMARIRATARAADARPKRSGQIGRVAIRLFDVLRRADAASLFHDAAMRRVMQAAGKLHGIGTAGDRHLSQKAVRKHLQALPVPPNWTSEQWDALAWTIRFHRGPEPKLKNGFAKLTEAQQTAVRTLAGLLRLARALRKAGIQSTRGLRPEKSADAIVLRVPGLPDTAETAARLAAAKHLLETAIGRPVILKSVPKPEEPLPPAEPIPEAPPTSEAAPA